METATIPVKSAWYSKINWTQVVGGVGTIVIAVASGLDDTTAAKVLAGWALAQNALTFVLRTWFNGTVSPASLGQ